MPELHPSPLLSNQPGTKWWRVDFHAHTPHSTDAYLGGEVVTEREWLLAHMAEGIDAVVIADHNGGGWIDRLKAAYEFLQEEGKQEFRPLVLFPGVEITTGEGVHLLAVLEPRFGTSQIQTLLGKLDFSVADFGKSDGKTENGIVKCVQKLAGDVCLLIPAHVNGPKGLFRSKIIEKGGASEDEEEVVQVDQRTKDTLLAHGSIFALETWKKRSADGWQASDFGGAKKTFATVYGSDSHRASEIGRRTSWVRMESPTLQGLRVALLDGEYSVKEFIAGQSHPGPNSPFRIERIGIRGTKYIGRNSMQEIALNPAFNAVIGGRGTGKSSILELVRQATKRAHSSQQDPSDHSRNSEFLIQEITSGLPAHVEVDYRLHGQVYRMSWEAQGDQFRLFSLDENGTVEPVTAEGDWTVRFPITVFSQKQLYAFKDQTAPLLAQLDATSAVDGAQWHRDWKRLEDEFIQIRSQMQLLRYEVALGKEVEAKIVDLKRQISIFETAGHKDVLRELSLRRTQKNELQEWTVAMEEVPEKLENLIQTFALQHLTLSEPVSEEDENSEDSENPIEETAAGSAEQRPEITAESDLVDESKRVVAEFEAKLRSARSIVGNLRESLKQWAEFIETSEWTRLQASSEVGYSGLVDALKSEGVLKPEQYGELVRALQAENKKLEGVKLKAKELETTGNLLQAKYKELEAHRKVLTARREEFLAGLFTSKSNISAKLVPFGDVAAAIRDLRSILNREGEVSREEFDSIEAALIAAPDDEEREELVRSVKSKLSRIAKGLEDDGDEPKLKIRVPFVTHLKSRTSEDLARLMTWFPPDRLQLSYRKGNTTTFKPLERGSPGQVAASVLAFLLAYGDEPIILDQPEDDLDNRLIYDLIVRELQRNKLRRQLVIVTHNPNIVVNGNADLVVPIDDHEGMALFPRAGALQIDEIRGAVCEIMEGGEEALERRFHRILHRRNQ